MGTWGFPRRGTPPEEISPGAESERKVHSMKQKLAALLAVLAVVAGRLRPRRWEFWLQREHPVPPGWKNPHGERDLDLFTSTLEENHKTSMPTSQKRSSRQEVEQVRAELPGMSEGQFYYSCGAFSPWWGRSTPAWVLPIPTTVILTALPFAVMYFEDGWHLMMLEEQNQQYLGYRLLAIDGTPIDEVYAKAKTIMRL